MLALLSVLKKSDEPCFSDAVQRQHAQAILWTDGVVRLARSLEQHGYVEVQPAPEGRLASFLRRKPPANFQISLTPAGAHVAAALPPLDRSGRIESVFWMTCAARVFFALPGALAAHMAQNGAWWPSERHNRRVPRPF